MYIFCVSKMSELENVKDWLKEIINESSKTVISNKFKNDFIKLKDLAYFNDEYIANKHNRTLLFNNKDYLDSATNAFKKLLKSYKKKQHKYNIINKFIIPNLIAISEQKASEVQDLRAVITPENIENSDLYDEITMNRLKLLMPNIERNSQLKIFYDYMFNTDRNYAYFIDSLINGTMKLPDNILLNIKNYNDFIDAYKNYGKPKKNSTSSQTSSDEFPNGGIIPYIQFLDEFKDLNKTGRSIDTSLKHIGNEFSRLIQIKEGRPGTTQNVQQVRGPGHKYDHIGYRT